MAFDLMRKSLLLSFVSLTSCVFSQMDAYRMSMSVADHILMAEPCKRNSSPTITDIHDGERYFLQGHFKLARRQFIGALKDIQRSKDPNANDNTITITKAGLAGAFDNRPRTIKLTEQIAVSSLNEGELINYTRCLNDLGIYYHSVGLLNMADIIFTKALKAQGQVLGKTSKNYVCTLHNLGNLRKDQGRYSDADQIFKYVLNYYAKTEGKNSCQYVISLNNKAMLDAKAGRIESALRTFEEMSEKSLSEVFLPESFDKERILLNKSITLRRLENDSAAYAIMSQIKNEYEENKHKRHPDYYDVILELGMTPPNDSTAPSINLEVLEDVLKSISGDYGSESPYYARVLALKAGIMMNDNLKVEALEVYQEIAQIYLTTYHDRHPDYINSLVDLGQMQWMMNQPEEARKNLTSAMESYQYIIDKDFPAMTEKEQRDFWLVLKENIEFYQGFALSQQAEHPELLEAAYNLEINTKGMILNNTKRVREEILNGDNDEIKQKFKRWTAIKENLSYYYSVDSEELKDEDIDLTDMENSVIELEKELNLESNAFSKSFHENSMDWKEIQSKLKDKEALIEILRINTLKDGESVSIYIGLLIKKEGGIKVIDLGKAEYMEGEAYQNYRIAVRRRKANVQSYDDYWKPIKAHLQGIEQVYLAQDGVYNKINVGGLRINESTFVIDEMNIVLISNSKSFGSKVLTQNSPQNGIYLFGNPDYSKNYNLNDLPGTEKEVLAIHALLDSAGKENEIYLLTEAKEEKIKSLKQPGILHVASHGFFTPAKGSYGRKLQVNDKISESNKDPMLRSGLLLANAGSVDEEAILKGEEDGILSAYEVMNLDLRNTEMVVLSACETGLGDIVDGEGVYGLIRAFNVAGSKYVLASLWEVDDYTTYKLMTETYREYGQTEDIKTAFLHAQLKIKKKSSDPSYWGAFVLIEN